MLVSALAMPASASNVDTDFMIHIPGSGVAFDVYSWRIKDNSSSSYVRYTSGPSSFIGIVYGGPYQSDVMSDCTSTEYYSGAPRDPAVIRVGQKGYIRQDVYETYGDRPSGACAKLAGKYQLNPFMALMENADMYQEQLEMMQTSEGALEEQNAIYMDSMAAKLQSLSTASEGFITTLFNVPASS